MRLTAEREEDAVAVAQRREAERGVFQMDERRPGVEFDVVGVDRHVRRRHRVIRIYQTIHREQAIPLRIREQHVRRVGPRLGARGSVNKLVVIAGERGAAHDFVAAPALEPRRGTRNIMCLQGKNVVADRRRQDVALVAEEN